jgi:hypothetical protein
MLHKFFLSLNESRDSAERLQKTLSVGPVMEREYRPAACLLTALPSQGQDKGVEPELCLGLFADSHKGLSGARGRDEPTDTDHT